MATGGDEVQVAVVGGTGVCGAFVVAELRRRGHEPRVLSRHAPDAGSAEHYRVDLSTGDGLRDALGGVDAVVDAANTTKPRAMRAVLVGGSERILRAEVELGVPHHVLVSIVGIDAVPLSYYRIKLEQEQVVLGGAVPATVVRSTQFHQLIERAFSTTARFGVLPRSRIVLQPIDARQTAAALVDAVERGPGQRIDMGGPEISAMTALARSWMEATSQHRPLLPLPVPLKLRRPVLAGALTAPAARREGLSFADWIRDAPALGSSC